MSGPSLQDYTGAYVSNAETNDRLHIEFTAATCADRLLSDHRKHIEQNRLGFGDPAFHFLWKLLLIEAAQRFSRPRCLEIGVFKGQVTSLWALLARQLSLPLELHAVTPLRGNPAPPPTLWHKLRYRLSASYREQVQNGNFYPLEDYETTVRNLFTFLGIRWDEVHLWRGYSTDPVLLSQIPKELHLVYVDGDHSYQGASSDIMNFAPRIAAGGWIVMDDASCDVPGTVFWKGHPAVSRACALLPDLGFRNTLNIGHNRVFERMPEPVGPANLR